MKHFLLSLFVIGLVSSVTSCIKRPGDVTLMEGRAFEEQGDYPGALEHYQKMSDPGFRQDCIHNLRYLYGDVLDALVAQQQEPASPYAAFDLGEAYYEKSLTVPQGKDVQQNSSGFDSATYFQERRKHFESQAMTALETATKLHPEYQDALLLQAQLAEKQDDPEKAIMIYQRLLDLKTESAVVLYRLSYLLYDRGQTKRAIELADQAAQEYPDDPNTHFVLGVLHAKGGDKAASLEAFHHTICADPHYIEAYYRIAQFFLSDRNPLDAERILLFGFLQNPDSLQLGLFYNSVQTLLDSLEEEEASSIVQDFEGEVIKDTAGNIDMTEQSLGLQLRYQRLRLKLIQRLRPYRLPCTEEEENRYFRHQIALMQERIESLEQQIAAAREETTTSEDENL